MNKILTAIALAIALPAIAHAQAAPPTPPTEKNCCCDKMGEKMKCCDKHGDAGGAHEEHSGHEQHQQHDKPKH